ncbi:MAG: SDR family NAD(P)-dependent oxidoreductase [Nitrospinota bacterium]
METGLKGKAAAVSGASWGLGYAIASGLAEEGARVSISARGRDRLEKAAREIAEATGAQVHAIQVDLATAQGCDAFIREAVDRLGNLDILVNNVGGLLAGTVESFQDKGWQQMLDWGLLSHIRCTRAAIPHLNDGGRVINLSGLSGKQYGPGGLTTGLVNSGIIAFSKYLAGELSPRNILVNNVCPGFIYTESWNERIQKMAADQGKDPEEVKKGFVDRTFLRRWGEPREIADMVVFLASERASFITGQTIIVGGGRDLFI